jgi:hypothetical protein
MNRHFISLLKPSKGVSIISIIIFGAILVAALNAYAYFNPDFPLSKYSVNYFLTSYNDRVRKADLEKIRVAIEKYYDDNDEYPGYNGWCGRIVSLMQPEVKDSINAYFPSKAIPQDPSFRGTNKDYFYLREDKDVYVLMGVFENPSSSVEYYNYEDCHDWPGDDVYNYQIIGSR